MKKIRILGKIKKILSNSTFLVKLKNNKDIICYISGKMKVNYIKILPGDEVLIEINFLSINKGRIIYRIK
ncbi:translation initiation factor IF-1 [Candidatus Vidania fulgoroideorum]